MKEDFIHYVWQYKKYDFSNLKTTNGEDLTIVNSGNYLQKEGPDFFNAQVVLDNQKWSEFGIAPLGPWKVSVLKVLPDMMLSLAK